MKTRLIVAAAMVAMPLAAQAQTAGAGVENNRSHGTEAGRSSTTGMDKTLEHQRQTGQDTTVNASTIVLPALAQIGLNMPQAPGDDTGLILGLCRYAAGDNPEGARAKAAEVLDAAREVPEARTVNNPAAASEYRPGWFLQFKPKDLWRESDEAAEDFQREFFRPLGSKPAAAPKRKEWVPAGIYQVKAVQGDTVTLEGEDGKAKAWKPADTHPPAGAYELVKPKELGERIDAAKAAWATLTPKAAAEGCVGGLTRAYVAGNQLAWPVARNEMADYARVATAANVTVLEMAGKVAQRVEAGLYRDTAAAMERARWHAADHLDATAKQFWQRFKTAQQTRVSLDMTGSCGMGWAAVMDGVNYDFCGTRHGFDVALAGGPWAGQGWLAGAQYQVRFGETWTASIAKRLGWDTTVSGSFAEKVSSFFSFGK